MSFGARSLQLAPIVTKSQCILLILNTPTRTGSRLCSSCCKQQARAHLKGLPRNNKSVWDRSSLKIWTRDILPRFLSSVNSDKHSSTTEAPKVESSTKMTIGEGIQLKGSSRKKTDYSISYTANVYITPIRAMTEYLLDSGDLEGLQKIKRRSPYPESEDITVFLRADVENRSVEKWGTKEALQKERLRRKIYSRRQTATNPSNFGETTQKRLHLDHTPEDKRLFMTGSGRVVLYAIVCNGTNAVFKCIAWIITGSHSMFSEFIHSVADTANQMILAYGLHQSLKKPDPVHPYGWVTFRNVSSLISGVGIFCVGAGLSWYHGVQGLLHPHQIESYYWAMAVLVGGFFTEGATALVAVHEVKKGARRAGIGVIDYVRSGNDPSTMVVLLEDFAAVLGVVVAGTAMSLSYYTGQPIYDAIGSLTVGSLLAVVAGVIIQTNTRALVGKSIAPEKRLQLTQELEDDRMIRALHDVKATVLGGQYVRFKAEVDFDGKEVARCYLEKQDLDLLFRDIKQVQTVDEMETFMLKHGDGIVDTLGGEVDRIEKNLKKRHPEIRHVDLEQL